MFLLTYVTNYFSVNKRQILFDMGKEGLQIFWYEANSPMNLSKP